MKAFIEKFISLTGISVTIILLASWLAGFINPQQNWVVSILCLVFPYIFLLGMIFAFLGLLIKNSKSWGLIVLLISTSSTFRKSFFNQSFHTAIQSASFDLMTHNIGSSLDGNKKLTWAFYQKINADIYCLQEWNEFTTARTIKDSLFRHYTSSIKYINNPWPIFSKFPILTAGELRSKAKGNGATWANIVYGKDTIRIYNVHLVSNRISGQTEELLNAETIKSKNSVRRILDVLKRYRNASTLRVDQAKILKQHMIRSPYPVILAGDFNDIPSSYIYRQLQKGLDDSFLQAGSGMAYTYAGKLPFLHIDHILYDPDFECQNLQIKRTAYSDHFPVKVKIGIK